MNFFRFIYDFCSKKGYISRVDVTDDVGERHHVTMRVHIIPR